MGGTTHTGSPPHTRCERHDVSMSLRESDPAIQIAVLREELAELREVLAHERRTIGSQIAEAQED